MWGAVYGVMDPATHSDAPHSKTVVAVSKPSGVKPDKYCACCGSGRPTFCRSCLTANNPLPENPSSLQRLRYAFLCPLHGRLARCLSLCLLVLLLYGALLTVTTKAALPGGSLFALVILVVCCSLAGLLVEKIHLPPLLGMLLVGFALRNIPYIDVVKDISHELSAALRSMALAVILTRAGLGLDPVALRKMSFGVVRLAFTPCLVEATVAAFTSHFILGFPWVWGFMLGFVLGAVSPAVVVPSMFSLQIRGYGIDKGIPTLVIAASSIDDVIAITGFGIAHSIAFAQGGLAWTIVKGPLEAIVGIIYGILLGIVLWYIPHIKHERKTAFRFLLLMAAGIFATFGSRVIDFSSAGPLGVLTLAFVAALRWRKESPEKCELVEAKYVGYVWTVFQPLLFGLIGAEVSLSIIQPSTIGLGLAVLCIGLVIRLIVSFFVVFGLGLNLREKLFIPFAWLPKATVQAAIGSVALDTARANHAPPDQISLGIQLLTIAALAIVITAPIGAVAISLAGPFLLSKSAVVVDRDIEICGQNATRVASSEPNATSPDNEEQSHEMDKLHEGSSDNVTHQVHSRSGFAEEVG